MASRTPTLTHERARAAGARVAPAIGPVIFDCYGLLLPTDQPGALSCSGCGAVVFPGGASS